MSLVILRAYNLDVNKFSLLRFAFGRVIIGMGELNLSPYRH